MKICGCVNEKDKEDVIKTATNSGADLVEHRIDFMQENLEGIYTQINKPVIATNRTTTEGGHCSEPEEKRKETLISAIEEGANYVDIEFNSHKEDVLNTARKKNCHVIVSYHNFSHTPDDNQLKEIMNQQMQEGDMGKIAVMPQSMEDCHRVLNLILEAKKINFPLIAFCMGELGKFTRPLALIYGSPLMYASINKTNAPGQLSVQELRKIIRDLK